MAKKKVIKKPAKKVCEVKEEPKAAKKVCKVEVPREPNKPADRCVTYGCFSVATETGKCARHARG